MVAKKGLILGGNGALGQAMVDSFRTGGWRVTSLDVVKNAAANHNVIVNADESMKHQVGELFEKTRKAYKEYDAIICVAGGFGCSNVKDEDIFAAYEH